ncbi:MAG: hypothetical protein QM831_32450 [Kofleriaceae bacterium]
MLRASLVGIVLVTGCVGDITGGGTGDTSGSGSGNTASEAIAIARFKSDAYPVFSTVCKGCHGGTGGSAPGFAQANDAETMRTQLLGYTPMIVDTDTPEQSRVLQKGAHEGTGALNATQAAGILGWIQAEHDAKAAGMGSGDTTYETDPTAPMICSGGAPGDVTCPINIVTLDKLDLPGAEIDFVVQALDSSIYVTDLYVKASTDGVYIDHPLFASVPDTGDPVIDSLDRFSSVKLDLPQAMTAPACPSASCMHIGAGAAAFVGFPPSNRLSISFKTIAKYVPDMTMPTQTVGCGTQGFATFLSKAKPVLTGTCAGCHGGANPGAQNAMDLSKLASTTDTNACLQVRAHINFADIPNSGILLAPAPNVDTTHPKKLMAGDTPTLPNFTTGIQAWITVEKSESPPE